jgi:hypothetical protein
MNRTRMVKRRLHSFLISISGIIADLDVVHVFNVTYVDCNMFLFPYMMFNP